MPGMQDYEIIAAATRQEMSLADLVEEAMRGPLAAASTWRTQGARCAMSRWLV